MAYDPAVEVLAAKLNLNYDTVYDLLHNGWSFDTKRYGETKFLKNTLPVEVAKTSNVFEENTDG